MRTLYEMQKINMSKIDKVFLTVQQELFQIHMRNAKTKTSKMSKFDKNFPNRIMRTRSITINNKNVKNVKI